MSGNDRESRFGQLTIDHMQVRATNPAHTHLQAHLARSRPRDRDVRQSERRARFFQQHGFHELTRVLYLPITDGTIRTSRPFVKSEF